MITITTNILFLAEQILSTQVVVLEIGFYQKHVNKLYIVVFDGDGETFFSIMCSYWTTSLFWGIISVYSWSHLNMNRPRHTK